MPHPECHAQTLHSAPWTNVPPAIRSAALRGVCAAALLALCPSGGALADGSNNPASPAELAPQNTPVTVPGQNAPIVSPPNQTSVPQTMQPALPAGNAIGQAMQSAANSGFYVNLFDVSELSAVTAGGLQHDPIFGNWAYLGADLDLQRMVEIGGATIHFVANEVAGQGRQALLTGSTWATLNNWASRDGMELRELTWDQHFLNDRLLLLAGRFNPTSDGFEGSPFFCQFATFMCATPRMFLADASAPTFQASTWMARFVYRLSGPLYVKAAVFEEEPFLAANNHGGWPGPDWGLNQSQGEMIPWEIGYNSEYTSDPYPRKYVLGGTYDSIDYADYYYNTEGRPLADGGKAQMHSGRSTIYLQGQQLVWKPAGATGINGLNIWATANYLTSGYGVMRASYTAGLFDYGPLPGRPLDTLGISMEENQFNHRVVEGADLRAAVHHDPASMSGNETMMEVVYGLHVYSGITFSPYLEYVWHPDQLGLTLPKPGLETAVQVGFMLRLNFNQMLGMPLLGRLQH